MAQLLATASLLLAACWCCVRGLSGDELLAQAFDAALLEMYNDGTVEAIMLHNDVQGFMEVMDCAGYPQYPANATGELLRVLQQGYVVVGQSSNFSATGYCVYVYPPQGATPALEQEAFRRVGVHYGYTLNVQYDLSFTTADDALDALADGKIDASASNFGQGSFYHGNTRRSDKFRRSCCTYAENVHLASTRASGITSRDVLDATIESVNKYSQAMLGAVGTSTFQSMQQIFINAVVYLYEDDATALAALNSKKLLAVAAYKHASTDDSASYSWYPIDYILPRSTFFRKESREVDKVKNLTSVENWQVGNEELVDVYNAALVWMVSLGKQADIFSSYNITSVSLGDCVTKEGGYSVPSTPSGTLGLVLARHQLLIGINELDSAPIVDSISQDQPMGALVDMERAIATWSASVPPVDLAPVLIFRAGDRVVRETQQRERRI
eukprot:TRINITY_DN2931_c0_g1_i5.p1 TRINITY_DN2931_c0_g1~~TRINITY_DN2931_c0_g1_i5.p1  ORF type:complete len:441 (+),score=105.10 TRINITY_DN2931_c0_g1_i5:60-1382(+)